MSKILKILLFFVCLASLSSFISRDISASTLGTAYLFLERMQVNQETEMILMVQPSSDFLAGGSLKITFVEEEGEWCSEEVVVDVIGVGSAAIDYSDWTIDEPLPENSGFTFSASCIPGNSGTSDAILVNNLGALQAGVRYGIKVLSNSNITTSSISGRKPILVELEEMSNYESREFVVNLLSSDTVTVSASVSEISTISCSVSHPSLSFGVLDKEGQYVTVQHNLTISASLTEGYYWGVYGAGNGVEAGLWKSTIPMSLIASTGETTVDLLTNSGFGLVASSTRGSVANDFVNTNPGIFGAINSGYEKARILFVDTEPEVNPLSIAVTIGARAGITAEVGNYTENITYLCGGLY